MHLYCVVGPFDAARVRWFLTLRTNMASIQSVFHDVVHDGDPDAVQIMLDTTEINVNLLDDNGDTPLFAASARGNVEIVRQLVAHPEIDLNANSRMNATPLHGAAAENNEEVIIILLGSGNCDVNSPGSNGVTPLHIACRSGYTILAELLLSMDTIDVNKESNIGMNALCYACKGGHVAIVRLLIQVPDIDVNKNNPLVMASKGGSGSVVDLLLAVPQIDVNQVSGKRTPLIVAVKKGRHDVVRSLLAHSEIRVNDTNEDHESPLSRAVKKGDLEIVKMLLKRNDTDVMRRDARGACLLHIAAERGWVDIVHSLCEGVSADVNVRRTSDGRTPIHCAVRKGQLDVIRRLLGCPAIQVNLVDRRGCTVFQRACLGGNLSIVKTLLEESEFNGNLSPLHVAVLHGSVEVVRFLIQQDRNEVNRPTIEGFYPLHFAAARGDADVLRALVEIDLTNINAQIPSTGWTPLMVACALGHIAIVKDLLRCPTIAPNKAAGDGRTPLHLAAEKGFVEVLNALLSVTQTEVSPIMCTNRRSPLTLAVLQGRLDVVKILFSSPKMDVKYELANTVSPLRIAASRGYLPIFQFLLKYEDELNTLNSPKIRKWIQDFGNRASTFPHVSVKTPADLWAVDSNEAITEEREGDIYHNVVQNMLKVKIEENVRIHLKKRFLVKASRNLFFLLIILRKNRSGSTSVHSENSSQGNERQELTACLFSAPYHFLSFISHKIIFVFRHLLPGDFKAGKNGMRFWDTLSCPAFHFPAENSLMFRSLGIANFKSATGCGTVLVTTCLPVHP